MKSDKLAEKVQKPKKFLSKPSKNGAKPTIIRFLPCWGIVWRAEGWKSCWTPPDVYLLQNKCSVPHQTSKLVLVWTKNNKKLVFREFNAQGCSATYKKWFSMKRNQVWVLGVKKIWSGSRYLPENASNLHNLTFFLQILPSRVSAAALSDSKKFISWVYMFS